MKYCNLDCKHLHVDIIERCGEGLFYEYRCMAQKGMPIVTIDTYCPYEELSETKQETNIENELEELKEHKKTLEFANLLLKAYRLMAKDYCENMGCSFCVHHTKCLEANHFEGLKGKDYLEVFFMKKAREE